MQPRTMNGTFTVRACALLVAVALGTMMIALGGARAQDDGARRILKAMSDYLMAQNTISATFDTDIEVITPQLQKIQFTSSGQLFMSRPNKLRATRSGGYSDVELVFNGRQVSILGKHNNLYAEVNVSGSSIDNLVNTLRDEVGVSIPGADLLIGNAYDYLMEDVIEARYIGHGVIDNVEVDHLAFRNAETDWQIWIERGSRPIPRKYVISSKSTAGAPQYTLQVRSWATDAPISPDMFTLKAPAGAKRVDAKDLHEIDEVPPGVIAGGQK